MFILYIRSKIDIVARTRRCLDGFWERKLDGHACTGVRQQEPKTGRSHLFKIAPIDMFPKSASKLIDFNFYHITKQ